MKRNISPKKFKVGDLVEWCVPWNGLYTSYKSGVVIAKVPAGIDADEILAICKRRWPEKNLRHGQHHDFGFERDHVSYLIHEIGSNSVYWPKVSSISKKY
jgi:hypothetical protein